MGKLVERPASDVRIQSYLPETWNGMKRVSKHFFTNLFSSKARVTIQYPEQKVQYAERYRGNHRLMLREDGSVRCVACFLCVTSCPADCIEIEAAETDDKAVEKAPIRFDVDHTRCIFCGLCEEACPCDAIRLDSGEHRAPAYCRGDEMSGKEDLLSRGALSVSKQGGNLS